MYLTFFFNNHASYFFSTITTPLSPQNFLQRCRISLALCLYFLLPIFMFHNIFHHPNIDFLLGMKLYLENVVKSTKNPPFIFLHTIDCYPQPPFLTLCWCFLCVCVYLLLPFINGNYNSFSKKKIQKKERKEKLKGSKLISTSFFNYIATNLFVPDCRKI